MFCGSQAANLRAAAAAAEAEEEEEDEGSEARSQVKHLQCQSFAFKYPNRD